MRESVFNTEVKNSLEAAGAWAYKIADQPTSWTHSLTRFTPDKPCDIIGIYKKNGFLVEGKQMRRFEAFGENRMRPSQIEAFNENEEISYVFLNVRIKAVKGVAKHENRLIIFPWKWLRTKWANGSIKAKELQSMLYIQGKDGLFDLKDFLDGQIATGR